MSATPDLTDAEAGELDDLLAAVPAPLEPLALDMLDGYLCGVLAQPVVVDPQQWLPHAFDWNLGHPDDDDPEAPRGTVLGPETPGWHAAKHERLLALVQRRHAALERALREDAWFDPLVMAPQDDAGQPLHGRAAIEAALAPWVLGFEHALSQFDMLEALGHPEVPDLLACVFRHLPEQTDEERQYTAALDAEHPLKSLDEALQDLVANVAALADIGREARFRVQTVRRYGPKVGRNEPCPCGSGRKYKLCHGSTSSTPNDPT